MSQPSTERLTQIDRPQEENGHVPGEIATYLLGAQGGAEDDFARLYEATNPVLLRYLRVTTDADPAVLALGAWATALRRLKVCPPDDDAWLELVVGSAREAAAGLGVDSGSSSTGTAYSDPDEVDPDEVDRAVEALRACPADEADVLAMGVVANLGRESTSRLTGHEPAAVLALVQQGQERLAMSFEELIAALRAPGRPDEVADLQLVTPLFTAALARPVPPAATPATATGGALPVAASSGPSPVEPLGIESLAQGSSNVVRLTSVGSATRATKRSTRSGVGAGVWLVAVGGMGAAVAMSGLLTAAVDGILGDHGVPPPATAQGPARPGTPSTDGGPQSEPSSGPTRPRTLQPGEAPRTGGGSTQPVALPGEFSVVQIELASFVLPDSSTPSTPTGTPTTPPGEVPVVAQPGSGPASVVPVGNGGPKAIAKAAKAKAAAKSAKTSAKATAKATARASKATQGKALGHAKDKAKGKAIGHHKSKGTAKA
jgi:hypothetical protein